MAPTLVVMAAGLGSRYGGLKQIDPIGPHGEIIIDYSIHDALQAGFDKIVFVVKEETAEVFREKIGKHIETLAETRYVLQDLHDLPPGLQAPVGRLKPWGTAHAVYAARAVVKEPFAVINADDFYGPSSYHILHEYLRGGSPDYCMVGYVLDNTLTENGHVARGVCTVGADGLLAGIREYTRIERRDGGVVYLEDGGTWGELPSDSTVSMNMWGFTPGLFPEIEGRFPDFLASSADNLLQAEYFLPNLIGALLHEGKARVKVLKTGERWFGVTYQQDKPLVCEAVLRLTEAGRYPRNLRGEG